MFLQRAFNDGYALGLLRDDDSHTYFTTFEDKPIPAGTYTVRLMPAEANPTHGECWEVQDVPGRTDILFHAGNDASDSDGCILVGEGVFGATITGSRAGLRRLKRFLAKLTTFTLTIADPAPSPRV